MQTKWQAKQAKPAKHWHPFKLDRAECRLCPRHCRPKNNRMGFCGVRGTIEGQFKTFNFGQSLAATEEIIETEAVNHYNPGSRILSMGNIGCMMACSFCQNWETSQIKHLNAQAVRYYSPADVIEICLKNNIPMISWTYNDPVVWHEFIIETSRLAQQQGIKTLYKSAFYIEQEPVKELIECIDVFSLSLKSLNEQFYQKQTKARLQPVLERIKQVAASGKHLEISQLLIPELNDSDEDILNTIDWVINNLGTDIPLHFVAFHPAYQYQHVERTNINSLKQARTLAHSKGLKHVYLGNTSETDVNDTFCQQCGAVLVKRYGLHAETVNLDEHAHCSQCGTLSTIFMPLAQTTTLMKTEGFANHHGPLLQFPLQSIIPTFGKKEITIHWHKEAQSVHILQLNAKDETETLFIQSIGYNHHIKKILSHGLDRFIISRHHPFETGVVISWNSDCQYQALALLDRAHYPTTNLCTSEHQSIPLKVVEII